MRQRKIVKFIIFSPKISNWFRCNANPCATDSGLLFDLSFNIEMANEKCWYRWWCCLWQPNENFTSKMLYKVWCYEELTHWLHTAFCHHKTNEREKRRNKRKAHQQRGERMLLCSLPPMPPNVIHYMHICWKCWGMQHMRIRQVIFSNNIEMNLKWLLVVTVTADCWLLYQALNMHWIAL